MKNAFILGLLFFGTFAMATIPLGYVDIQKALRTVEAGKKAQAQLKKEVEGKQAALKKERDALQKRGEKLQKRAALMNAKVRQEEEAKFQRDLIAFQKKGQETQIQLQQQERKLTEPILKELRAIIEEIGAKKKFQLLVEKNEGGVIYAAKGLDITDEVISTFNAKRKKKRKK